MTSKKPKKMKPKDIEDKLRALRKALKKSIKDNTGMNWQEFNRKTLNQNIPQKTWDIADCRMIVTINTLLRKRKKRPYNNRT